MRCCICKFIGYKVVDCFFFWYRYFVLFFRSLFFCVENVETIEDFAGVVLQFVVCENLFLVYDDVGDVSEVFFFTVDIFNFFASMDITFAFVGDEVVGSFFFFLSFFSVFDSQGFLMFILDLVIFIVCLGIFFFFIFESFVLVDFEVFNDVDDFEEF